MSETSMTRVTDLYVRCSYPMRPDAIAASDTCQHPANTAVRDGQGNLWWRCPSHEGELRNGILRAQRGGRTMTANPVRELGHIEDIDGIALSVGVDYGTVAMYVGPWLSADGVRLTPRGLAALRGLLDEAERFAAAENSAEEEG